MIEVSQTYKDTLATGRRNFNAFIYITLADGTNLPALTNANLRAFSIDDAVSDDNAFTMLGSTIINQCKITIDNLHGEYRNYNFKYANVVVYIDYALIDGTTERIRKGTFYVDTDLYVNGTVELTCFDNMAKFDKEYSLSNLQYPATVRDIILDACTVCNVPFSYNNIPNSDILVSTRPNKNQTTFRQVLGWACQIVGCFARCNTLGQLEVKWCDLDVLEDAYGSLDGGTFDDNTPYETGATADGGTFNPWNTGYIISSSSFSSQAESHNFYYNYSQDIAIEDTIISGVSIVVETDSTDNQETYTTGSEGYVVTIEKNELVTSEIAQQIVTLLGDKLIGMRFRKATTTHMGDPTIEAGDIAVLWDTKNHSYPIIVTRTEFSIGKQQKTVCGVESPSRNVATRYTETAQAYLKIKEQLRQEKTSRELAIETLTGRLAASSGLYSTIEQTDTGNIYYLHDRPDLDESQIIWKMTVEAWGVSSDGGQTWNGGMTVDGDTIVRILSAVGIDADWIKTGIIRDRSGLNFINLDNGNLRFRSSTSKAYLDFNDAIITTHNRWSGVKGVELQDNKVLLYNWDTDGQLAGYLTSLADTGDSTVYGAGFVKSYNASYVGLGYDKNTDSKVYLGFELVGRDSNTPVIRSHLKHIFRDEIQLQRYINGSYTPCFRLYTGDTKDSTTKVTHVRSSYLHITEQEIANNAGILISSDAVRNALGLDSFEYSTITITDDVNIRGGYDLRLISGSHLELCYGSEFVNLYSWPQNGELCVRSSGGLSCYGTKNRIVKTKEYGDVALSAYETTTPYFGDIGSAKLDATGVCYVELDNVFLATITTDMEYFVFLQKEGPGDLWVANKEKTYFEINGTPNLKFAWEVKARQVGYEKQRLERDYATSDEESVNYADLGFSEYVQFVNQFNNQSLPSDDE